MRSSGTVITMPPDLEISAHKVSSVWAICWGTSHRLGWKLWGLLTLETCKTQCQEQRFNFPTNTAMSMPDWRWCEALGSRD